MIVDADAGNFWRKVIAFVGGLDLCKGRYDTRKHPIFSTLESVHKDDYHNPNAKRASKQRSSFQKMKASYDDGYSSLKGFPTCWD